MNIHFKRIYRVTVWRQAVNGFVGQNHSFFEEIGNGLEITAMRMQCKVVKNLGSEPNTCELTLINLAETTRALMQQRPLRVRIEAGYDGEPRLLFVGDVGPSPGSKHDGCKWETKLLIADGLRAFAHARVNLSYKPGTSVLTILKDVAATMNLALPKELEKDSQLKAQLHAGEAAMGFSSDELTRLLAPYGYSFSMQNGQLRVLRDEEAQAGTEREISKETAMVGTPTMGVPDKSGKPALATAKSLVYPELNPGGRIRIISRSVPAGLYKIQQVTHDLDSSEGPWHTECEAKPL